MRKHHPVVAFVASTACIIGFFAYRMNVPADGPLPFERRLLKSSGQNEPLVPAGEVWFEEPAYPPATNIVVGGPRGPDGKIVPRYFYAHDNTIESFTDESGRVRWRARRPGGRNPDHDTQFRALGGPPDESRFSAPR